MSEYEVSLVMNDGLVRIESHEYGRQLWSSGTSRKSKACHVCQTSQPVKAITWKPITHGYNRMHRICSACIAKMSRGRPRHES